MFTFLYRVQPAYIDKVQSIKPSMPLPEALLMKLCLGLLGASLTDWGWAASLPVTVSMILATVVSTPGVPQNHLGLLCCSLRGLWGPCPASPPVHHCSEAALGLSLTVSPPADGPTLPLLLGLAWRVLRKDEGQVLEVAVPVLTSKEVSEAAKCFLPRLGQCWGCPH